MLGQYAHFFAASATASAGFIGLLLVALSIANHDDTEFGTRERWTVLAGSASLALADIFFVSLISSIGGPGLFAATSLVMAIVGLIGTSQLMPRAYRAGNFERGFSKRPLNMAFATVSAAGYVTQPSLAVALLANLRSSGLTRARVFMLVALFCSALARAWEVAGIGHRSLRDARTGAEVEEHSSQVVDSAGIDPGRRPNLSSRPDLPPLRRP
jgi:hypothetical protein